MNLRARIASAWGEWKHDRQEWKRDRARQRELNRLIRREFNLPIVNIWIVLMGAFLLAALAVVMLIFSIPGGVQ